MKTIFKAGLFFLILALSTIMGGFAGYYAAEYHTQDVACYERPQEETKTQTVAQTVTQLQSVADIAQMCTTSVVNITVKEDTKGYTGGSAVTQTVKGHGTGVIIRESGYIVTCHHVVEDANSITVTLDDKTEYDATLVGQDERFDLAVIKVEAKNLIAAELGDSNAMRAGESVVIIGNPLGEFGSSVSAGVLSAPTREITIEGVPLRLMQTDAAVNPGNSGGALFNMDGKLVGIVNAKISASGIEGIGFAIPWATIESKVEAIIEKGNTGEKAVLGVSTKVSSCYVNDKKRNCLEVTSVRSGSAAEAAGIEIGDFLLSANGKDLQENSDLTLLIKYLEPGDEVEFEVYRNKETLVLLAVLGSE